MKKEDWWDMVCYTSSMKVGYRIQWNMQNGNVRAKSNDHEYWRYSYCNVKALYAFHIGHQLLKGG